MRPGRRLDGAALGTIGDAGCFSFFPNKNMTTGEGGAVVFRRQEHADRARLLRSHAMTTLTWDRHRGHATSYDVLDVGFNYRIDEIRAALGVSQLARVPIVQRGPARSSPAAIGSASQSTTGCTSRSSPARGESSFHLAPVLARTPEARDALREALRIERIQTSVHYPPIHRFTSYAGAGALPVTEEIADRVLTLPLHPALLPETVDEVCDLLFRAGRQRWQRPLRSARAAPASGCDDPRDGSAPCSSLPALLGLAWVATVLLWQDPVTALYAKRAQARLSSDYEQRVREIQPEPRGPVKKRGAARHALHAASGCRRRREQAVGRLRIPRMGLSTVVVDGHGLELAEEGARASTSARTCREKGSSCTSPATARPTRHRSRTSTGSSPVTSSTSRRRTRPSTIASPGHVIVPATDIGRLKSRGREELALQACHPRFFATERYIVYARLVNVHRVDG